MWKIYFAGSIRGGRQDQVLYEKLVDALKTYGKVFTEHVGSTEGVEKGNSRANSRYCFRSVCFMSSHLYVYDTKNVSKRAFAHRTGSKRALARGFLLLRGITYSVET